MRIEPLPRWWAIAAEAAIALRTVSRERSTWPEDMGGACCVAAVLLTMLYRHVGIEAMLSDGFRRWGRGRADVHCWARTKGHIVDITATQFGEEAIVYVTSAASKLYEGARVGPLGAVADGLKAMPTRECWHPANPRRHHEVIAEAFCSVTGMPLRRARNVVTETIGVSVLD